MHIESIEIDEHNEEHVTSHGVTLTDIEQVFTNAPTVRRNRSGRSADYLATGITDGGSRIRIAFDHNPENGSVRPIAAWRIP